MRRRFMSQVAGALLLATAFPQSFAQNNYPSRPVRVLVGFSAGGSSDLLARLTAQSLSQAFDQQFVVENRPGATGNIAHEYVARSSPDGYTLLFATTDVTLNGATTDGLRFDPEKDFTPVTLLTFAPLILFVRSDFPASNLKELLAYVKARPNELNYASTGRGTTTHLVAEQLKQLAGLDIQHVPYKGAAPAMVALLSGETSMLFTTYVSARSQVEAGKFKPIAIASNERAKQLPDVQTFAELGYPMEIGTWFGLLAPAGTPPGIVEKLNEALQKASRSKDFQNQILDMGGNLLMTPPGPFKDFVGADVRKWKELVKRTMSNADLK